MLIFFGLLKLVITYGLFFLLLGCADKLPSEVNEYNKPTEIINLGDEAYAQGYYERAGDYYSTLNEYFPYSVEDELGLSKAVTAYYLSLIHI